MSEADSSLFSVLPSVPKVALVTGAAKRIGREIALSLAKAGFDLALHFHQSEAEILETAALIRACGRKTCLLKADLSLEEEVKKLIPTAEKELGQPGVLINNAGLFLYDNAETADFKSRHLHLAINLHAPFILMQDFARSLKKTLTANGVIINMLDQRIFSLTPEFVSYTISKAGLYTLTQTMAMAFAPQIRVMGIGPGPTLKNIHQTEAHFKAQYQQTPLERPVSPEDIAKTVLYILSVPSLTGQMIAVDSGQHLNFGPPLKNVPLG